MLDLDFVRSQFPALESPWTFMDNAGGTAPCRQVIDRVRSHMERLPFQLGASYPGSVDAGEAVESGRRAAATLVGADAEEIVLASSTTAIVRRLAAALRAGWSEGDEVVVTNLDHEANIGPWRELEATGIVLREWCVQPETMTLDLEDLEPLLNSRTRLVAFTHVSNVVGSILDVASITARVRAAGALSCVDGVAYTPHRRVDVERLGADFYLASLYKVYGPHLALMFGRSELLRQMKGAAHFFLPADSGPAKLEPGGVNYEQASSLVGILEYLHAVGSHHGLAGELDLCFARIAEHEEDLVRPLLTFLDEHPRTRIVGNPSPASSARVPTVSFTVDGRKASEIPPLLDRRSIAVRYGHFYAYRLIRDLGLLERDGVVRVSLVHYNSPEEVERLIEALDELLPRAPR